jgi:hypothetical protein
MQELQQKIWHLTEENQKLKTFKPVATVEEVEMLKEENKRLRIELQKVGLSENLNENPTPKSQMENIFIGNSDLEDLPVKPGSGPSLASTLKTCQLCRVNFPCIHSSVTSEPASKNYSLTSSRQNVTNRSTNSTVAYSERLFSKRPESPIKLNFRYKLPGALIESDVIAAEIKENELRKKEMNLIRSRLNKIAEIESYRKEQFRKEMQDLEEKKKKDEENNRKKIAEDAKKRKALKEKKKIVEEYKVAKKVNEELENALAKEYARDAETKRKAKNELKKKKLLEYYSNKKKLE